MIIIVKFIIIFDNKKRSLGLSCKIIDVFCTREGYHVLNIGKIVCDHSIKIKASADWNRYFLARFVYFQAYHAFIA